MITPRIATLAALRGMKTIECHEPMVSLKNVLSCHTDNPELEPSTGRDIWVRQTVMDKLVAAENTLQKADKQFKLSVHYGYRDPKVQTSKFNEMYAQFKQLHPEEDIETLEERTNLMIAYPTIAGHPTGGAVDVTIHYGDQPLDMGCRMYDFDQPDKIQTYYAEISEVQRAKRKLLHDALKTAGFAPFYGEWWHYSYGDREWALFYDQPHAIYDQLDRQTFLP